MPTRCKRLLSIRLVACVFAASISTAGWAEDVPSYTPDVLGSTDEGRLAMDRFRLADGLTVSLFAAEPMLANPVAFAVDGKERIFVAETFRHEAGVPDIRKHMDWLEDDLASRTVADRTAMLKKYLGDTVGTYLVEHERVRRIVDRDGDGVADESTVFADGFHHVPDGIGAGLLIDGDSVWYSCIPDLWRLTDADDDGVAEQRKSVHHGYGVHVGFIGHDLHGLCYGPDGRIYFSIGDRGIHVEEGGNVVDRADDGTVLRCEPDGSNLEIFAHGLRNPQELAFDDFGNWFTVDNNSDSGDRARITHLVEGGDSGWRIGFQFLVAPVSRGPWNGEKMWHPPHEEQPAYIIPPIANFSDGPSGLAYYPGTGLGDRYRDRFFLCDFRGASAQSGIRTFRLEQSGASFELADDDQFVWSILATDLAFAPDGGLYVSDWVEGWAKPKKGRIYRFEDPRARESEVVREVASLLREGMGDQTDKMLATLLAHVDRRIRLAAQFELVRREADDMLFDAATSSEDRRARLHAIWGLGQLGRENVNSVDQILQLLSDDDADVRAQTARVAGDARSRLAFEALVRRLNDAAPKVRVEAAIALGKLGRGDAVAPLLEVMRKHGDGDAVERHSVVMGLVGCASPGQLAQAASDPNPAVRMSVLLAMRRSAHPAIQSFLQDQDARLVREAARAIYDEPIPAAMDELAAMISTPRDDEWLMRRVVRANHRLGTADGARAIAEYAANDSVDDTLRMAALDALVDWVDPNPLDAIVGLSRPLPERDTDDFAESLAPALLSILHTGSAELRTRTCQAAGALGVQQTGKLLFEIVQADSLPGEVRIAALEALDQMDSDRLAVAVDVAVHAPSPKLNVVANRLLAKTDPEEAARRLAASLSEGSVEQRQEALAALSGIDIPAAAAVIEDQMQRLLDDDIAEAVRLDVLEAARNRSERSVRALLDIYAGRLDANDPLAEYRAALVGGDDWAGRRLFMNRMDLSCVRCHRIRDTGGNVGPDLSEIGKTKSREYLLESLVAPSRQIAKGYESVIVITDSGQSITGILRYETDERLTLMTAEGAIVNIPIDTIEERAVGISAMPDQLTKQLTMLEIRDLVEFLASQVRAPD